MPLDARELHSRLGKLRKSLKNFSKDPTVDEVHDLRTRTRRVESILHGLQLDRSSREKKLLVGLNSIRKLAGKVRERDVLTSHVVGLGLKDDPNCLVRLVHHLGTERQRHAAKLYSVVQQEGPPARTRLRDARRKLDSAVKSASKAKSSLDSKGTENDASLHAMSLALRLSQELGGVSRLSRDNLHQYRIELKRLRYVLEMADSDEVSQRRFLDALQDVQDAIGEWHDWVELGGIAAKALKHDEGNCQLIKKITDTSERKLAGALQRTEQLRRRYLKADQSTRGTGLRSKRQKPRISGPVLVAASEIAA